MPFLSFLDNLLEDVDIVFQKGADNFEIEHKIGKFLARVQYPLKATICFL